MNLVVVQNFRHGVAEGVPQSAGEHLDVRIAEPQATLRVYRSWHLPDSMQMRNLPRPGARPAGLRRQRCATKSSYDIQGNQSVEPVN